MLCIAQRVLEARVVVDGETVGEIGPGLLCLVGLVSGDTDDDVAFMLRKVPKLRIFADDEGKMNRSVLDIEGGLLLVSQFTLAASLKKGTRPSFQNAMEPTKAKAMFDGFVQKLRAEHNVKIETGRFAADMKVHLVNDGPVTILLDSRL